ncbi:MAG: bestrophin family ion channel [Jaaginema sp. PMC 1079.18]|nr:bestrophin family ion channel [Jaaginema sp. PMC 1080.18]MEC4849656.1 bestrophin family ion channel [Jaaginema sp. PMC 1079.18]MEC4866084.1 bestrophin family ion channel [Jaaginema sp. PMC 1078.18]
MKSTPLNLGLAEAEKSWLATALTLRSSVIPAIFPRVLLCTGFGIFVSFLFERGYPIALPLSTSVIPSLVLSLLLVFRTNTAYERFWEGRKQWGSLINSSRNFARQMWVSIAENSERDRVRKIGMLRLLIAFAIATKRHLRYEKIDEELSAFMPESLYLKLQKMNNPPLEIALWLGDYLQDRYNQNCLNAYQLAAMFKLLDNLVDALGACERILKTPIPLAYAIHLKQLLLIYCLLLPFQMVNEFVWLTGGIVGVVSFTLFGIEAIGLEIENPFGYDANDLPLDAMCQTMQTNIEDLITLAPSVCNWDNIEQDYDKKSRQQNW